MSGRWRPGPLEALLLLLPAAVLLPGPLAASETQSWLDNSLAIHVSDSWRLKVTQELRSNDLDYGDRFLRNWSVGAFRSLPKNTYAGLSYKREWEDKVGFTRKENRVTLEGGWKKALASRFGFDARFRSEFRNFEGGRGRDHTRFRLRARLRRKLEVGGLEVTPFVWTELFSSPSSLEEFERSRSSVGASVRLNSHSELLVGYVLQSTDDKGTIEAPLVGFDLSF